MSVWGPLRKLNPKWVPMPICSLGTVEVASRPLFDMLATVLGAPSGWIGSLVPTQKGCSYVLHVKRKSEGEAATLLFCLKRFLIQSDQTGLSRTGSWSPARCGHLGGGKGGRPGWAAGHHSHPRPAGRKQPERAGAPHPPHVRSRPGPAPSSLQLARCPHPLAGGAQWEAGAGLAEPSAAL